MKISEVIVESKNTFLRPGMLSGSYTDKQLIQLGFKRAINGSWYIASDLFQKLVSTGQLKESASGYIPSNAEKNDPRFKTALTVDVHPDSIKKNAKKLGLGNIHRSGIPPIARTDGKS